MSRREFSKKVKLQAWDRCKGQCEVCHARLYLGKFAFDHDLPDALGGKPTLSNCKVLCSNCHGAKTTGEIPAYAKSNRQRSKFLIGTTRRKRTWGYGKGDAMKKKITGEVVPR